MTTALRWASRWRVYSLLHAQYQRFHSQPSAPDDRPLLPEEVQALLDYRGGLEKYRPDPEWHEHVVEHFRFNVRRMVEQARRANVPLWLVDPICNLRDSPPFKAGNRVDLTSDQLLRWQQLREEAQPLFSNRSAAGCAVAGTSRTDR